MDFNPSDLQRMLVESAQRFVESHYTLEHRRSLRATDDGLDAPGWQAIADLGWLAIIMPENCGGLGGNLTDAAVLASVLGTRCVTEPFVSTAIIGATFLSHNSGSDGSLLEGLVTGGRRIALAHDEPGERYAFGSDRAVLLKRSGGRWVMSGQKLLALDGPSATDLVVTAQSSEGLALVCIPAESAGITREDYALHDGSRASDLRFDGVSVPDGAVMATGRDAQALLDLALDRARIILGAQATGSMEAMLDLCSAYLKERQQFGQAIGNFQSLQHIMADMFVATHQARSALYYALSCADAEPATRARAVALARITIAEAGQLVSRQAIQLHGGYGVTDEYEVSHHFRRQMVLEKQYGDMAHAIASATS